MLHKISVAQFSDRDLLDAVRRTVGSERQQTAQFLALIAEVDARRLYLGQSCSSLFKYCIDILHLSEHAAYHRIEAARAARQFPVILDLVAEGAMTLTSVAMLRPHLTPENHLRLLEAARHKKKCEVELQVRALSPKPDERALVRRVSAATAQKARPADMVPTSTSRDEGATSPCEVKTEMLAPRPTIAPLAPERYLLKVTITGETYARLRRAQQLMRHTTPSGDPAAILDRALTVLVDQLERAKIAKAARPRNSAAHDSRRGHQHSRHIPASVRRQVWARDQGRCAFVGAHGRCTEDGQLEFHHVIPFADGGATSTENLALRCRAHNKHEMTLWSGTDSIV